MDLLPLDDPRWKKLDHRNWHNGKPSEWTPDAPFVPDELAKLEKNPGDDKRFGDLWPWLCSEGSTYAAAFASVPHFVKFAKQLPPAKRGHYLTVIGLIVTDATPNAGPSFAIKPFVARGYRKALKESLAMLLEALVCRHNATEFRYLMGALAALQGRRKLAKVLQNMDCICGECPNCGVCVYPPELQKAYK